MERKINHKAPAGSVSTFGVAAITGLSLAAIGLSAPPARAQTLQTFGAGSAVHAVDRQANFDRLSTNGTPLSDYIEGGLFIGTDGDSWVGEGFPPFDPFHGANGSDRAFYCPYGGSQGWTIIRAVPAQRIYGIEFMYGNGWTTGQIYGPYPWGNHDAVVSWQTRRAGAVVASGTIGGAPLLEMGTIVGFTDRTGFDELWVKCTIASSGDPTLQVLALDNLVAQLHWINCVADIDDGSGTGTPDGGVGIEDLLYYLLQYEAGTLRADVDDGTGTGTPDGGVGIEDLLYYLLRYDAGC